MSDTINVHTCTCDYHISYAGMLKTQKANLVSEQDFHKKSEIDSKPVVTSKVHVIMNST